MDGFDLQELSEKLEYNGFEVKVCSDSESAANFISSKCNGKIVGVGDSRTIVEIGLLEKLKQQNGNNLHASQLDKSRESRVKAVNSDVYILSANAVCYDTGEIVNIDSTCNRLAGSLYCAEEVYFIVPKNKIEENLEKALHRIRNVVAPKNVKIHGYKTPCSATGECHDCNSPDRICRVTCIMHKKPKEIYVCVVLIDECLGF